MNKSNKENISKNKPNVINKSNEGGKVNNTNDKVNSGSNSKEKNIPLSDSQNIFLNLLIELKHEMQTNQQEMQKIIQENQKTNQQEMQKTIQQEIQKIIQQEMQKTIQQEIQKIIQQEMQKTIQQEMQKIIQENQKTNQQEIQKIITLENQKFKEMEEDYKRKLIQVKFDNDSSPVNFANISVAPSQASWKHLKKYNQLCDYQDHPIFPFALSYYHSKNKDNFDSFLKLAKNLMEMYKQTGACSENEGHFSCEASSILNQSKLFKNMEFKHQKNVSLPNKKSMIPDIILCDELSKTFLVIEFSFEKEKKFQLLTYAVKFLRDQIARRPILLVEFIMKGQKNKRGHGKIHNVNFYILYIENSSTFSYKKINGGISHNNVQPQHLIPSNQTTKNNSTSIEKVNISKKSSQTKKEVAQKSKNKSTSIEKVSSSNKSSQTKVTTSLQDSSNNSITGGNEQSIEEEEVASILFSVHKCSSFILNNPTNKMQKYGKNVRLVHLYDEIEKIQKLKVIKSFVYDEPVEFQRSYIGYQILNENPEKFGLRNIEILKCKDNMTFVIYDFLESYENNLPKKVGDILQLFLQLKSFHELYGPHGDVRMSNMIFGPTVALIDFDFAPWKNYPFTYALELDDTERHPEIIKNLENSKETPILKKHDWYSAAAIAQRFKLKDAKQKNQKLFQKVCNYLQMNDSKKFNSKNAPKEISNDSINKALEILEKLKDYSLEYVSEQKN